MLPSGELSLRFVYTDQKCHKFQKCSIQSKNRSVYFKMVLRILLVIEMLIDFLYTLFNYLLYMRVKIKVDLKLLFNLGYVVHYVNSKTNFI